jgi:drug/metabolite transporter (DMT)-like permease
MHEQRTLPRSVYLILLLLTFGWGFNWPMIKLAVSGMSPLVFRVYCVLSGAVGMLTIARLSGLSLAVPAGQWPRLALAALFNITLWNITSALGVQYLPAGRSAVLAYTMPLWTVLLSWPILGERLTGRRLLGLLLGMGGMLLLLGEHLFALRAAPLGTLLMLSAALSWALGTVILKRFPIALPPSVLTGWLMALGLPPLLLLLPFQSGSVAPVGTGAWIGLFYNLIVAAILCHWAWFKIVSIASAGVASLATLMIPVVGVFSGILVLSERPTWQEFTALGLVLAALATVLVGRRADQVACAVRTKR